MSSEHCERHRCVRVCGGRQRSSCHWDIEREVVSLTIFLSLLLSTSQTNPSGIFKLMKHRFTLLNILCAKNYILFATTVGENFNVLSKMFAYLSYQCVFLHTNYLSLPLRKQRMSCPQDTLFREENNDTDAFSLLLRFKVDFINLWQIMLSQFPIAWDRDPPSILWERSWS